MTLRGLGRLAGLLLTLACAGYFLRYAAVNYPSIAEVGLGAGDLWITLLLTVPYVLAIVLAAAAWMLLLKGRSANLAFTEIFAIYGRAQFAKYLPGNIGHHIGRVWLARRAGLSIKVCLQTMVVETILFIALGACLSGLAMYAFAYDLPAEMALSAYAQVLPIFAGLVLVLPLLIPSLARLLKPMKLGSQVNEVLNFWPGALVSLRAMGLMLVCFFLNGIILWGLARFVFGEPGGDLLFYLGLYAVSWLAGFLVPGAPAGLGVREAIMLAVLGPLYGSALAIGLSIAARLVSTVGDVLALLLAVRIASIGRPGPQPPGAADSV